MKKTHVVFIGGGISSTLFIATHLLMVDKIDKDAVDFVIAALPNEHPDVWRLITSVEKLFDITIKRIGPNKSVWELFHEQKFIGNSRFDNCSKTLKRDVCRNYMQENYPNQDVTVALGITHHEIDRELSIRRNWTKNGYKVYFPLSQYPELTGEFMRDTCMRLFGFIPELYTLGFSHNNCGGACVKAGKYQWKLLLEKQPDTYKEWEENENLFRENNPTLDRTVLREMKKGVYHRITLKTFRERLEAIDSKKLEAMKTLANGNEAVLGELIAIELDMEIDNTPECKFCESAGGGYEDTDENFNTID